MYYTSLLYTFSATLDNYTNTLINIHFMSFCCYRNLFRWWIFPPVPNRVNWRKWTNILFDTGREGWTERLGCWSSSSSSLSSPRCRRSTSSSSSSSSQKYQKYQGTFWPIFCKLYQYLHQLTFWWKHQTTYLLLVKLQYSASCKQVTTTKYVADVRKWVNSHSHIEKVTKFLRKMCRSGKGLDFMLNCAGCDHTDGGSAWNWLLWEVLHPSRGGDGPGGLGQLHRQLPPLQPHVEAVQDHVPQDVPLARGKERFGRLPGAGQEGQPKPASTQGRILYGKFKCQVTVKK